MIKNKRLKPEVEKVELDQFWKGEFSIGEIYLPYWMQWGRKTPQLSDWALLRSQPRAEGGSSSFVKESGWGGMAMSAPDAGS